MATKKSKQTDQLYISQDEFNKDKELIAVAKECHKDYGEYLEERVRLWISNQAYSRIKRSAKRQKISPIELVFKLLRASKKKK